MTETEGQSHGLGGMLIFAITYLICFFSILSLMPAELFIYANTNQLTTPVNWNGMTFLSYLYIDNKNITSAMTTDNAGTYEQTFHLTDGTTIKTEVIFGWTTTGAPNWFENMYHVENENGTLLFARWFYTWWWHDIDYITWKGSDNYFSDETITYENSLFALVTNTTNSYIYRQGKSGDQQRYNLYIGYNQTKYGSFKDAFSAEELKLFIGQGYSDTFAKINAWDIIAQILFFQTPEIFGSSGEIAIVLNLIFAIPTWICIAYVLYRLILMAIPFLG